MKFFKEIAAVFAITALLSSGIFAVAQAADVLTKPFGGYVFAFVVPTPLCPIAHQLIYDYASNSVKGIALFPGSILYRNFNFYSANVYVLGTIYTTTLPCALPYPIYPIDQAGTN